MLFPVILLFIEAADNLAKTWAVEGRQVRARQIYASFVVRGKRIRNQYLQASCVKASNVCLRRGKIPCQFFNKPETRCGRLFATIHLVIFLLVGGQFVGVGVPEKETHSEEVSTSSAGVVYFLLS